MHNESDDPQIIHNRLQELKEKNCEVVLVILNGVGEETYKSIKYFGNQKLGIVTQYDIPGRFYHFREKSIFLDVRISLLLQRISKIENSIWLERKSVVGSLMNISRFSTYKISSKNSMLNLVVLMAQSL